MWLSEESDMMLKWMIFENLSGFSNSSTVITENWQAKGVSATDEVHLDESKTSNAMSALRFTYFQIINNQLAIDDLKVSERI